ncbi:MAG: flagellar basal body-associated FliL family protein [Deltaproteobacteria bacterium]|jgi:flagellar FliL protein|nr:flagellar basal body-associated FliL family protein [Deltaproteobacteria bacterium]
MAEKKAKEAKEAKKTAPPPEPDESVGSSAAADSKGGKLKLIIIVIVAVAIGGAGAFAAMRFFSKPASVEKVAAGEDEFSKTVTSADPEEEEPIVAPSKGKIEAKPAESSGGHGAPAAEGAAAVVQGPITVELKPFTTNLNDQSGRRFLKVTMGMEVENQEAADELNKMMPDIQDSILILLSSQSVDDIASVDGKERLRSQILNRTNSFMAHYKVKKVKYSEFIIQ